jgi:hypothetical protein
VFILLYLASLYMVVLPALIGPVLDRQASAMLTIGLVAHDYPTGFT